ncbi:MAG: FkbM family methyltransferase [Ginsengibacter sp.]
MKLFSQIRSIITFINNHPLAGKHKFRAYTKFLKWQLGQLINPGEKKIAFAGSTSLLISKGMTGATGNIYAGLHEFADMGFLLHFLRKGDVFADVGANVGSYTVLAAGYTRAKTIAFEPVPATFKSLQNNIELNHLEQYVTAYNIGISAQKSKLLFTSSHDTGNHVISVAENNNGQQVIEVAVTSIDEILKGDDVPLLIKIDVEGFETEVITGMKQTLKDHKLKAIIIELNGSGGRYGYDENNIHKTLLAEGFEAYVYDPFKRECSHVISYGAHNTLYLRGMDFIVNRIKTASKVSLFSEIF